VPSADDATSSAGKLTGFPSVIAAIVARKWTQQAACLESYRRFVLEPRSEANSPGSILGWDAKHGQTGIAPNGVELHPALRLRGSCRKHAP